jgi:Na+-transporting methylmalonyl-CoA/oxaloacetate decarboxylase gamma subunit
VNFTLDETNDIYITSSNGRDLIDSLHFPTGDGPFVVMDYITSDQGDRIETVDTIPYSPIENVSYGRLMDGETIGGDNGWAFLVKTTPSSNNVILDSEAAAQRFKEFDPFGLIMAMTAMSVVFIALMLLYLIFKQVGKASINAGRKKAAKAGVAPDIAAAVQEASGEAYAAIAVALHWHIQQEEAHDVENTILTINKVTRTYSPWSSKIYGLRDSLYKK